MNQVTTSIAVKRKQQKFYAEVYHKHRTIARSELFHTAAGASIAGKMLAYQKAHKPFRL